MRQVPKRCQLSTVYCTYWDILGHSQFVHTEGSLATLVRQAPTEAATHWCALVHCQLGTGNQSYTGTLGHCLLYIQRTLATSWRRGGGTHWDILGHSQFVHKEGSLWCQQPTGTLGHCQLGTDNNSVGHCQWGTLWESTVHTEGIATNQTHTMGHIVALPTVHIKSTDNSTGA